MINKPSVRLVTDLDHVLYGLSEEHKDTILKMLDIQKALFSDDIELNLFNSKNNYILPYCQIIGYIENDKDYSDETIIKLVNELYNRMFKNRRR